MLCYVIIFPVSLGGTACVGRFAVLYFSPFSTIRLNSPL